MAKQFAGSEERFVGSTAINDRLEIEGDAANAVERLLNIRGPKPAERVSVELTIASAKGGTGQVRSKGNTSRHP